MRMVRPYGLMDYYWTSVVTGLRSLPGRRYTRESVARVVNPLSYPRYMEYQLVMEQLGSLDGCRVLDVGSPKLPALLLARNPRCQLYATDIRDYFIGSMRHFVTRMGLGYRLGNGLHLEVQDARHLTYDGAAFDRLYSISVVEHIPGDGDSQAMREFSRVLRPGGVVSLTVPFSAAGYRDEYVAGDVFERQGTGQATFYQRHYDQEALLRRLIEPSGLRPTATAFFGEPGIRFEPSWNRIPMRWKVPVLWAQPFLAKAFLKRVGPDRLDAACGVAVRLVKQEA
jgi:SAM-dependent methyltransferase